LDSTLPGAWIAIFARCPYFDGTLESFDAEAAKAVSGVQAVVFLLPGPKHGEPLTANLALGVAVLAEDTWADIVLSTSRLSARPALGIAMRCNRFHVLSIALRQFFETWRLRNRQGVLREAIIGSQFRFFAAFEIADRRKLAPKVIVLRTGNEDAVAPDGLMNV
jgi:hypothetical protein